MIFKGVSRVFFNFQKSFSSVFVMFQSTWSFYCLTSMFNFNAICRGRTLCGGHCLPSEVDFDRYLSWPDIVCFFMLFFRSRLWSLFVVFQSNWLCYCLPLSCLELLLEVQSVFFNIFLMILRLSLKSLFFWYFSYDFKIMIPLPPQVPLF